MKVSAIGPTDVFPAGGPLSTSARLLFSLQRISLCRWTISNGLLGADGCGIYLAPCLLLIDLELERELYVGELSKFKDAILPIVAAIDGMSAPALIHFCFNAGTPTQSGIGIKWKWNVPVW